MIKESKFQSNSIVYVNDCHDGLSVNPVVTIMLYLTTLQHVGRENPACATELLATWSLVSKAGFSSLGTYLQAGFF